jgi:hypothetical protein
MHAVERPFQACHGEERSDVAIHLENLRGLPQSAGLLRHDKLEFISRSGATKQSS